MTDKVTSLVDIQLLNYSYDASQVIFNDLSMELSAEKLLLLGANGAGKSTLLKLIAGILPTESVRIESDSISYLGHELQLYPELSVRDNLNYISELIQLTELEKIIATWKLTELLDEKVNKLSAGQRKRVSMACYANFQQDIVLLDEPSVNLDEAGKIIFREALKKVSGKLVLIASHDLDYFLPIVDRVIFIDTEASSVQFFTLGDKDSYQEVKQLYLELIR